MTAQGLREARSELAAASHLIAGGFRRQAVSRAYYAAFYAASEAIGAVGRRRSKHSGVLSAFGEHLIKPGHIPPEAGAALRRLFDLRNRVDYFFDPAGLEQAEEALSEARTVVDAVQAWLDERDVSSAG